MSAPLLERLKSILVYEEEGLAPSKSFQAAVANASLSSIGSTDFSSTSNTAYTSLVAEILDGNAKNQFALVTEFDNSTDIVSTTNFAINPSGATAAIMWDFQIPDATCDETSLTNAYMTTGISAVDDYYNGWYLIGLNDTNNGLYEITDFQSATGNFIATYDSIPTAGDFMVPVKVLQGNPIEMTVSAGTALEREISTDTLAQEGIIVGAIEETSINLGMEIRGLGTAADSGTTAEAPAESGILLDKVFTESLSTGGTAIATPSTTVCAYSAGNFSNFDMCLINGEAAGITSDNGAAVTVVSGHWTSAPIADDILYGGASYSPKDTGHSSVGFMAFKGDREMCLISGCMPSVQLALEGNSIGRLNLNYMSTGGISLPYDKTHEDVYDTTAPVVVKSNQSRVVIDGDVLEADVMSITADLLPSPQKKGGAFNCFENNGGLYYTERNPTITMTVYFEDSSYIKKYRSQKEFDLLIQVGSVAGNAVALWVPRAQIIETPGMGDDNGLMTQTLTFRALRPATANQPDFVYTIF